MNDYIATKRKKQRANHIRLLKTMRQTAQCRIRESKYDIKVNLAIEQH